jgi:hypothetical protein
VNRFATARLIPDVIDERQARTVNIPSGLAISLLVIEQGELLRNFQVGKRGFDHVMALPGKTAVRIREIQAQVTELLPDLPTDKFACELGAAQVHQRYKQRYDPVYASSPRLHA